MRSSIRSAYCAYPSTSSIVNSPTGGWRSSVRESRTQSARTVCTDSPRWSASKRIWKARLRALFRAATVSCSPAEVVARAGVDLDLLAGGDEERDADLVAGLQGGGLGATGGAVALDARVGVLDGQLDRGGQLDVEHLALVLGDGGGEALDQEVGGVADGLAVDHELVVRVHVHEDEVLAVHVRELHVPAVDGGRFDLHAGVERLVDDLAGEHVLELGAHEGGALAGLDVLELDDGPELASVELEHQAVLE